MKTYLNHSQNNIINNNLLTRKRIAQAEHRDGISKEEKQLYRPAQAISFGGSAGLSKLMQKGFKSTVEFVYDNEAAYNAIYSLIIAGIIKPIAVINMPGSEDKDKQMIATKNFLQAFLGSFLSFTIGGGFIKKAVDVVKNNLKLVEDFTQDNKIILTDKASETAKEIATSILEKEKSTIKFKFKAAKDSIKDSKGIKKLGKFYKTYNSAKYAPTAEEVVEKADSLIKNFNKNHRKAFEKNIDFLKEIKAGATGKTWINKVEATTYEDAFETFWKNSTGSVTTIAKAMIASALLPSVMAILFAKRNREKEQALKTKQNTLVNNTAFVNEQKQFQKMMNKNSSSISFTGNILNSAIDGTASLIEKAGMSKPLAWFTKNVVASWKKPSARMADIESILLTCYWIQNTSRSDKYEPSQKLGLNVHTALTTVVSSTCAFIIDWLFDGMIDKSKIKYTNKLKELANSKNIETITKNCEDMIGSKDIIKKFSHVDFDNVELVEKTIKDLTKTYGKKLSKFKSLTIFTLVVRFLVPVLLVPHSGKLKKKVVELKDKKQNNEIKNQPKK